MKILFIGTVKFSKKILQKILDLNYKIEGVCCKKKSLLNSDFEDLTPLCKKNNIPFRITNNINSKDSINWIQSIKPDIIFCFGWSSLIKHELLTLAPMGIVGYHPTKLPQNRGRHPLIWSLTLGLKKTASTFFFMDEHADSGDILSQKDLKISYYDDAQSLYNKIVETASSQIEEFMPLLANSNFTRVKQNNKLANFWRKRNKADGKIDFRMSSKNIYNLVRALTKPYPGAYILYNEKEVKIWKVKEIINTKNNIESGVILGKTSNSIFVKTGDGAIEILASEFTDFPKIGEYL